MNSAASAGRQWSQRLDETRERKKGQMIMKALECMEMSSFRVKEIQKKSREKILRKKKVLFSVCEAKGKTIESFLFYLEK